MLQDRLNKLEERINHLESRVSEDEKAIIVNNQLLNNYKKYNFTNLLLHFSQFLCLLLVKETYLRHF